jgi:UDP-N-acetylmuramate dehydrogenase
LLGKRAAFDEPMSKHTSLRVGGPAEALVLPESRAELREVLELCHKHELPVRILGAGFNTLVPDAGLRAAVVRLHGLRKLARSDDGRVLAEAGTSHSRVTRFCADEGLAGLEFAVGIPGTVGGWLAMNAGIAEREMRDVVECIEFLDPATGKCQEMRAEQLRFRYRALEVPADVVLLKARFHTEPSDPEEVRERMRSFLAERRETQPIDQLSCGSVFKNPPGDYAGRLIDAAGLKGSRVGGAEISTVHAGFIINRGSATATDVLQLMDQARAEVLQRFQIELEPEVRVWGEEL